MDTPNFHDLFARIQSRRFGIAEARTLLNYSAYVAGRHPDAHIMSISRAPDFQLYDRQDGVSYDERAYHSMFPSASAAVAAIAGALNCRAGEALLRLFGIQGVERAALHSRSAVKGAPDMWIRSAVAVGGVITGAMYAGEVTAFVTLVFNKFQDQQLVLTTAYPRAMPSPGQLMPPDGRDLMEFKGQLSTYPVE